MASIIDKLKVTGQLTLKHYGPDGNLIREYNHKNLVVTSGLQWIAARFADTGIPTQMGYIAIGASATAPTLADTTLGAELGRSAVAVSGGTVSGTTVTFTATFAAGTGTGAITEAAIFNSASSGTMLSRTTFLPVNKGAADTLAVNWIITIS